MLVSAREAAVRLSTIGMPRRQAGLALGAGLAGEPLRTSSATLYEAGRIDDLLARPVVATGAVFRECPFGLFLDRRVTDVRRLEELGLSAVEDLRLGVWAGALLGLSIDQDGPLPYVSTVCGFVVLGGEIVDVTSGANGRHRLHLTDPGPWFDAWRGHRWPTGAGREWSLLGRPGVTGVAVGESGT
ncbi:hypothetical protein [Nocardioides endophyticus]